ARRRRRCARVGQQLRGAVHGAARTAGRRRRPVRGGAGRARHPRRHGRRGQGRGAVTITAPLDVDGPAAPPRSNGELVCSEPWESRAFGLAMALHGNGAFQWEDFRKQLIAAVGAWERGHPEGECWSYYRCWLTALEQVLDTGGVVAREQLVTRA